MLYNIHTDLWGTPYGRKREGKIGKNTRNFKRREDTCLGSVNVTVPNVVQGWRFE